MQGRYRLADQVDTSHAFLYGHRYWPEVKRAVAALVARIKEFPQKSTLVEQIRAIAREVAAQKRVDESLVTGITAVAFMTLQQAGLEAFAAETGAAQIDEQERATVAGEDFAGTREGR